MSMNNGPENTGPLAGLLVIGPNPLVTVTV